MPSSTSSSDPERRARSFLVGCAAALLAVEVLFALALPVDPGRHEVDRLAASTLEGKPRGDAVVLADSVSYGVLLGVEEAAGVADLTSNQKIGVPGNVFLLRRYLEHAEEPVRVVVYTALPLSLSEELSPLSPYLQPYFTSVFTRDAEIADIEAFGRADLAAAMRAERAARRWSFPSFLRRGAVLNPVGTWLRGLKRRGGGATMPVELPMSAKRKIRERQAIRRFRTSAETDAYLERLAESTREEGAVLALSPPPIAPSIRESWYESGYLDAYEESMEALASRHAHVVFRPECPYEPEDDRRFVDGVHLDPAGKEAYAAALVWWIDELR